MSEDVRVTGYLRRPPDGPACWPASPGCRRTTHNWSGSPWLEKLFTENTEWELMSLYSAQVAYLCVLCSSGLFYPATRKEGWQSPSRTLQLPPRQIQRSGQPCCTRWGGRCTPARWWSSPEKEKQKHKGQTGKVMQNVMFITCCLSAEISLMSVIFNNISLCQQTKGVKANY